MGSNQSIVYCIIIGNLGLWGERHQDYLHLKYLLSTLLAARSNHQSIYTNLKSFQCKKKIIFLTLMTCLFWEENEKSKEKKLTLQVCFLFYEKHMNAKKHEDLPNQLFLKHI